jgi:hypothetical protein
MVITDAALGVLAHRVLGVLRCLQWGEFSDRTNQRERHWHSSLDMRPGLPCQNSGQGGKRAADMLRDPQLPAVFRVDTYCT